MGDDLKSTDTGTTTGQSDRSSNTPGVSGRKLTIIILSSLAIVGGSLAYLLTVYDRMDDQRAKTKDVWRSLANALDSNYKEIEKQSAAELGVDEAWTQQFVKLADQFRTATNIEAQTETANQLEARLSELTASATRPKLSEMDQTLKQQVELYNMSIEAESAILESWAGSFVHKILPAPVRSKLSTDR